MTTFAAAEITKDRLRVWQKRNEREGFACTPALLVNIRHDAPHIGQLVLNMTEDIPLPHVYALLIKAAKEIESEMRKGN